jgi:hypothetical protein
MLRPDLARDMVDRLRLGLADRGAVGRFLLDQIDAALSAGIEVRQEPLRKGTRSEWDKGGIVRRAPSDLEMLLIHLQVLRAYFVDAQRVAVAASQALRQKFEVDEVVLALEPDLDMEQLSDRRAGVIPLRELEQRADDGDITDAVLHLIALVEGEGLPTTERV